MKKIYTLFILLPNLAAVSLAGQSKVDTAQEHIITQYCASASPACKQLLRQTFGQLQKLNTEYHELQATYEALGQKNNTTPPTSKDTSNNIHAETIKQLQTTNSQLEDQVARLQADSAQQEQSLSGLKSRITSLNQKALKQKQLVETQEKEIKECSDTSTQKLTQLRSQHQLKLNKATTDNTQLKQQNEQLSEENTTLKEQAHTQSISTNASQAQIQRLRKELAQVQEEAKALNSQPSKTSSTETEALEAKIEHDKNTIHEYLKQFGNQNAKIKALEAQLSQAQTTKPESGKLATFRQEEISYLTKLKAKLEALIKFMGPAKYNVLHGQDIFK